MRRSLDDTLLALREHVLACASRCLRPDLRVLVYAPEWEAEMLARLPGAAAAWARDGASVELIDLGQQFLAELERRPQRLAQLLSDDAEGKPTVPANLGTIATSLLQQLLGAELAPPACCRVLTNTGALATFTSYSTVANQLYDAVPAATVLLFPGEGDDRELNILGLRADPTYRVPRL